MCIQQDVIEGLMPTAVTTAHEELLPCDGCGMPIPEPHDLCGTCELAQHAEAVVVPREDV